ncbi:MAG: hypothetical protein GYA50_01625 [Eubacteriaceae bacterium]|nr:hypothetical protein [Eubacteriaceae bacterium]
MINYCEPEIPEIYWINSLTYKCENCGNVFELTFTNGYDVIKLKEINGDEIRWLPTYGKGGYLDLITKLIPEHSKDDVITMIESKKFIKELKKYSEKGSNGQGFDFSIARHECINCKSKELKILDEKVLMKPKLTWLKISCELKNR